jgi:hypothetical protein
LVNFFKNLEQKQKTSKSVAAKRAHTKHREKEKYISTQKKNIKRQVVKKLTFILCLCYMYVGECQ